MCRLTARALGRALDRVMHSCSTFGRSGSTAASTLDSSALKAARVMARTMASNQIMHRNRTSLVLCLFCYRCFSGRAQAILLLSFVVHNFQQTAGGSSNQWLATSRIPVRLIHGHGGPGNMVGPRMA